MAYSNPATGGGLAWVLPAHYPQFVPLVTGATAGVNVALDNLQLYGEAEVGFIDPGCLNCELNIRIARING